MKQPDLYDRVALARDLDQHDLKQGDVATVVDIVPHPAGGPDGVILEVTNALGDSLKIVIVALGDVESLSANEVFTVRQPAETA
jgi:Domain of unknown function (DUF4926)